MFYSMSVAYWVPAFAGMTLRDSALQSGRDILALALKLHAGRERHGFHERREILLQIGIGIGFERRRPEMSLQYLARRRRHRHGDIPLATERQAEIDVLAQELGREGRSPIQVDQSRRFVAREHRAHDAVVDEGEKRVARNPHL